MDDDSVSDCISTLCHFHCVWGEWIRRMRMKSLWRNHRSLHNSFHAQFQSISVLLHPTNGTAHEPIVTDVCLSVCLSVVCHLQPTSQEAAFVGNLMWPCLPILPLTPPCVLSNVRLFVHAATNNSSILCVSRTVWHNLRSRLLNRSDFQSISILVTISMD